MPYSSYLDGLCDRRYVVVKKIIPSFNPVRTIESLPHLDITRTLREKSISERCKDA